MADEELARHLETWRGFCKLMTYSSVAAAVTLVLLALFLL